MELNIVYEKEISKLNSLLQACGYFPSEEKSVEYQNKGEFTRKTYLPKESEDKQSFIEIYSNEENGIIFIKHEPKIQRIKEFILTEDNKNYLGYISCITKLTDYLSRKQIL
jgi:hypothetical protein